MIHVHGIKLIRKRAGIVADFCPFCRDLARFDARDVCRVRHINFITAGRSERVATEITCTSCGGLLGLGLDVAHPTRTPEHDLVELASKTSSLGVTNLANRMELEKRVSTRTLSALERKQLLREPFLEMEYVTRMREQRSNDFAIGTLMVVLDAFAAMLSFAACRIVISTRPIPQDWLLFGVVSTVVTILHAYWTYHRLRDNWKRWQLSRPSLTLLARSLQPLNPTLDELEEALSPGGDRPLAVARHTTPEKILAAIDRYRVSPVGRER